MILSEKRIKQLTTKACSVFKDTDNEFDALAVTRIMKRYAEAKEPLIATLRRHPDWDEQNLAIIQTHEFNRTIDLQLAKELIDAINDIGEVHTD